MTCTIARPNPQALFDTMTSLFSTTVLGGGTVIPESNEWYVVSLNYAMMETFYAISEEQWRKRDPRYACCGDLINLAGLDGVYPYAAKFAQGYGRISGTAGSALPSSIQISYSGKTYSSVGTLPATMPLTGALDLRFKAIEAGATGNVAGAGVNGTASLVNPIAGVDASVTIYGGRFCGGSEAEECEAFRARYLARRQFAPRATSAWIKQKLLEWPCVTRVCERSGSCCEAYLTQEQACAAGTKEFQYYVIFDDTFANGLAPQCVVDEITTWMFGERQGYGEGQAEINICGRVYTAQALPVDVVIYGAECYTTSQRNEIVEQVTDLFKTFCPSQLVTTKQVELVISQILGYVPNLEVQFKTESTNADILPCGDIEPHCDYLVTLASIQFASDGPTLSGCIG